MLEARILTALALVAVFLTVLFLFPPRAVGITFALVAAMAAWEWSGLLKAAAQGRIAYALLTFALCLLFWTRPEDGFLLLWSLAALFWLCFAPLWLKWHWSTACATLGLVLILPAWAALVGLYEKSPLLLLAVMGLVWIADIAAYFTGRALGRHKLAPTISPAKTWEGVAGALLAVQVYGFAVAPALPVVQNLDRGLIAVCLLLLTVLAIVGDLFESLAKRQAGVKDSSHLLPGHGGILDRIDSLLSTLPLVALGLYLTA